MLDLHISGIGMISSVGYDAQTSCASIRAGISRPSEYFAYSQLDYATQDMEPIVVHQIKGVTEGYHFLGLWLKLAKLCVQDLLQHNDFPDLSDTLFWGKTGVIAAVPNMEDERYLGRTGTSIDYLKTDYVNKVIRHFSLPIRESNIYITSYASSGSLAAIKLANDLILRGDIDRAIILSVDSYINEASLDWLQKFNRLKTAENPTGVSPGESGCCFMIESGNSLIQRNSQSLAKVEQIELGMEKESILRDEPVTGIALKIALAKILDGYSADNPLKATIISDANGENWKALQLANARAGNKGLKDSSPVLFPAMSIGDVGASISAASICLATQIFARRYNSLDKVIVITSSEYGHVGLAKLSIN